MKIENGLENETTKFAFNSDISDKTDSTQKLIDFSEILILEIKEGYILDIQHSRMVHDVIAFTLILPSNQTRFTQKIVSFSYKEIIEKLFRTLKEDHVVIETTKSNGHIPNLETLIDARFFMVILSNTIILKMSILKTNMKIKAIIKSIQYEEKLIEFEAFLWE